MKLQNAPQNEAILSNVGEIGEFRIRNSAKAFNILSSGLYANKIRAIIRELSCNAVDSHVAANRADTPFDVHLPNQMEPWFSIRDYGTGLNHEQVTNIYTTYFESTKTDSNDFIGALGLGSKSPFSYTDNFTVTAIKDGRKGIYTAFINEQGIPSIALMTEEESAEPSGVEVKFSVNERYDFGKFRDEAQHVYKYFQLRPVITGSAEFQFKEVSYVEKDIVPGVHTTSSSSSVAIMGNIAYPIDVPNAEKNLGQLARMLNCGLEMHFAIGELDFQASREGLSYIPTTIEAIKRKLETLNVQLAVHVELKAKEFTNIWEQAIWLNKRRDETLWHNAVTKYIVDNKHPMFDLTNQSSWSYCRLIPFKVFEKELQSKYNIVVRGFSKSRSSNTCSASKADYDHDRTTNTSVHYWRFPVQEGVVFVKNDTNIGALERAKYHWRKEDPKNLPYSSAVYVLEVADKSKPAKFDAFLSSISNPPNVKFASELLKKERAQSSISGKNVSILKLEERGSGGYYRSKEMVWRDAGKADSFDDAQTYYYLPLSGFEVVSKLGTKFNAKEFFEDLKRCGVAKLRVEVYGVRKGDLEYIKGQSNWINVEDMVQTELKGMDANRKFNMAISQLSRDEGFDINKTIASLIENKTSPYAKLADKFSNFEKIDYSEFSLRRLCNNFGIDLELDKVKQTVTKEISAVLARYPLLKELERSKMHSAIAEYINLIDSKKGV